MMGIDNPQPAAPDQAQAQDPQEVVAGKTVCTRRINSQLESVGGDPYAR